MSDNSFIYDLKDKRGWIIGCFKEKNNYDSYLQLGKTSFIEPWSDPDIHYHTQAQELYIVLNGEMWIQVGDDTILRVKEKGLLLVQPNVPHSVIGGKGKIQHIGIKVPHEKDKKINVRKNESAINEEYIQKYNRNSINSSKGFLADLNDNKNQNCWLLGLGTATYKTKELCLAFMSYADENEMKKDEHDDSLHYHSKSTEWYLSIKGDQEILVEEDQITVPEGCLLKIPTMKAHKILSYSYPFEGFTMRTPIFLNDKVTLKTYNL